MQEDLLHDVVAVETRGGTRVHLRFENGVAGEIDLRRVIGTFRGVFAPLKRAAYLARVVVNADVGTIVWPNGADVDPVVLYCAVRGLSVPGDERTRRRSARPHPPHVAAVPRH